MKKKSKRKPHNPDNPKHISDYNRRCKYVNIPSPTYSHPHFADQQNKATEDAQKDKEEQKAEVAKKSSPSIGQRIKNFFRRKTA